MNSFTEEAKYDVSNIPGSQIAEIYEEKRTDAWSVIENLHITKRIVSVCALLIIILRRAGFHSTNHTRARSKNRTREPQPKHFGTRRHHILCQLSLARASSVTSSFERLVQEITASATSWRFISRRPSAVIYPIPTRKWCGSIGGCETSTASAASVEAQAQAIRAACCCSV
jgi:hypothetical protein